jgi:cobalt-precorrin 5A hydrolase
VGSDVSGAFFFGYFLLGQQKKVTAGGARPAGCLPRPEAPPAPQAQEPTTQLAVGLGCDRNTPISTVEQALQEALQQAGQAQEDIAILATITAKADEAAFRELADKLAKPLRFFSAEQLAKVEVPNPSATVHRHMGTPSVSEAAALLAAGTTAQDLLVEKHRLRGPDGKHATVSIARIPKEEKQP